MGHKLVLEVPEDVYESLAKIAHQAGRQPESLAVQLLAQAARGGEDDPLEQFIGAFDSKGSDWADRHDHYLGRAIEEPRA